MIKWLPALLHETNTFRHKMQSLPVVTTLIRRCSRRLLLTGELLTRRTLPVLFLWGDEEANGGADDAGGTCAVD